MPTCSAVAQPEGIQQFRREVGRFLADAAILDKIDFYLGRTKRTYISGKGIRFMGQLILDGKIGVFIDDAKLDQNDAGAQYDPRGNCLYFRSSMFKTKAESTAYSPYALTPPKPGDHTYFVRGKDTDHVVVHEAAHAWIDFRDRNIYGFRNETAAFLAEAVFMHRTGVMASHTNPFVPYDPYQAVNAAGATVLELAVHIAAEQGLFEPSGAVVRREAYLPLLKKISGMSAYENKSRLARGSADGIPLDD